MSDHKGLASRLERFPEVERAAYHTEPREWVEVVVENDRLGPRVLLVIAIHRAGVEECIAAGDGEYRAATLR